MHLLGLTATPTHGEVKKRGWLARLFPQGIVYQVDPQALMAAGVLARPVLEEARTDFEPTLDEREYEQWVGTNRDLPEDVIDTLATNRERSIPLHPWFEAVLLEIQEGQRSGWVFNPASWSSPRIVDSF